MNPEEGNLRPQILDRFGLRIIVHGLEEDRERLEAYRRAQAYRLNPRSVVNQFRTETALARREIQAARDLLPSVELPLEVAQVGIRLIQRLQIDSLRAEIALFECARAYAAADARQKIMLSDLRIVAPMALRLRRSLFMTCYFQEQAQEDLDLKKILDEALSPEI
jgi:magnesium chelatase subunit I